MSTIKFRFRSFSLFSKAFLSFSIIKMLDFSKQMQTAGRSNVQQPQGNPQYGAPGYSQQPPRQDPYSPTKQYDHELNQVNIYNQILNSSPSSSSKPRLAQNDFRLTQFDAGRTNQSSPNHRGEPINVSTLDIANQLEMLLINSPESRNRNNLYKPAFRNIDQEKPAFTSAFSTSSMGGQQYGMSQPNSQYQPSGNFNGQGPYNYGQGNGSQATAGQDNFQGSPYGSPVQVPNPNQTNQNTMNSNYNSPFMSPQKVPEFPQNNFNDPNNRGRSQDKSPYGNGMMGDFNQSPSRTEDAGSFGMNSQPMGGNFQNPSSPGRMPDMSTGRDSSPGPFRAEMGGVVFVYLDSWKRAKQYPRSSHGCRTVR